MKKPAFLFLAPLSLAACVEGDPLTSEVVAENTVVQYTTDCAALGLGDRSATITAPVHGQIYDVDGLNKVRFHFVEPNLFHFYSETGLRYDGILVHAGGETAAHDFGGENNGWGWLTAPGEVVPEAVTVCWDDDLFVNPDGYVGLGSQYLWSIEKTGVDWYLTLAEGQGYLAHYDVTVAPAGASALGQLVFGPVRVFNHTTTPTTIDGINVYVGEVGATVDCPTVTLPYTLQPGAWFSCNYQATVEGTPGDLSAHVLTSAGLPSAAGGEAAEWFIVKQTGEAIDECVIVEDSMVGHLGSVCLGEGAKTFEYSVEIGPFPACTPFEVDNVASFRGIDTGSTGSDSWLVAGETACDEGCSLTQGYWRTHSEHGPARYDATWATLPSGADTLFFQAGASYYSVLWTAPRGNAYYSLAHQYIAAALNRANGAAFGDAQAAFDAATTLFQTYTPALIGGLSTKSSLRAQFLALATTLDDYNNGRLGPGHCDE